MGCRSKHSLKHQSLCCSPSSLVLCVSLWSQTCGKCACCIGDPHFGHTHMHSAGGPAAPSPCKRSGTLGVQFATLLLTPIGVSEGVGEIVAAEPHSGAVAVCAIVSVIEVALIIAFLHSCYSGGQVRDFLVARRRDSLKILHRCALSTCKKPGDVQPAAIEDDDVAILSQVNQMVAQCATNYAQAANVVIAITLAIRLPWFVVELFHGGTTWRLVGLGASCMWFALSAAGSIRPSLCNSRCVVCWH